MGGEVGRLSDFLRGCGLPADAPADPEDFVLAEDAGGLAACAAAEVHGSDALLRSVAVAPARRKSGLGARLAEQALARAEARGACAAWLLTVTAESFFARRGFARVARERAPEWLRAHALWRDHCPDTAVLMRREPAAPRLLFAYGTLRSGSTVAAARSLHARAPSAGAARLRGRLLDLGAYPGLAEPGDREIAGELFRLPEEPGERSALLAEVDAYEAIGPRSETGLPFAREARVARRPDDSPALCWVYLWRGATG